jgi:hypothetical protein
MLIVASQSADPIKFAFKERQSASGLIRPVPNVDDRLGELVGIPRTFGVGTPAPNVAAVAWKRAKFSGRDFSYLPVKPERVERVIADDVAFLDAHPTRTRKGR